jgi:hypothetical protein
LLLPLAPEEVGRGGLALLRVPSLRGGKGRREKGFGGREQEGAGEEKQRERHRQRPASKDRAGRQAARVVRGCASGGGEEEPAGSLFPIPLAAVI